MNLGTSFCKHPSLFGRKIHLDVMPLLLYTLRCQTSEHPQQNFIPSYLMGNSPGSVRRYTSLLM